MDNQTKLTVVVTPDHINRGMPGNCFCCPLAIAISEVAPMLKDISVSHRVLGRRSNGVYVRGTLPESIITWMVRFDLEKRGEPCTFDLIMVDD
jgi:hypothetical protein